MTEETVFPPDVEELGDNSEVIEIEEVVIEPIRSKRGTLNFEGGVQKTVWEAEKRRVTHYTTKKLVATDDGFFVPPEDIVGECSECREKGITTVLSKKSACRCLVCGRLIGPCHQRVVKGKVFCGTHWFYAFVENVRAKTFGVVRKKHG